MFEMDKMSSLTWDSAAWMYSVIIGVVLTRHFMFIANLLQEPKAIKFYYPYLAFILVSILNLYLQWYTGKQAYTDIEGDILGFFVRSFSDAIGCINGLIIVPKDKLLENYFDMKSWFMKIKKIYFFISILTGLLVVIMALLSYVEGNPLATTETIIGISALMVIVILLHMAAAFSKNDYYLSFHGTFMTILFSYSLSQL